jgi:hypothetical protein
VIKKRIWQMLGANKLLEKNLGMYLRCENTPANSVHHQGIDNGVGSMDRRSMGISKVR